MSSFSLRSISGRLYGLLLLFAIGFIGIVSYQLINLRTNLDSFKRAELTSVVESATSIVQGFYDQAQAGTLSEEEAKVQALATLASIRYHAETYGARLFCVDYLQLAGVAGVGNNINDRIEAVSHAAETLMSRLRDGTPVTSEAVDVILAWSSCRPRGNWVIERSAISPWRPVVK